MSVSVDEAEEICKNAVHSNRLTEWEETFINDTLDRIEQFGERTRITDRQSEVLERIRSKVLG